jgi:hypothetical protein
MDTSSAFPRWNLFAAVLDDILRIHGIRLGQLDDRTCVDPPIHPEKVRRLKRSLLLPKHFHVLSPDEIDTLVQAFGLSPREKIRLRAAMLTTAIEAMLMGRIPSGAALAAAKLFFPVIEQALLDHYGEFDDTIRGDDDLLNEDYETPYDESVEDSERTADSLISPERPDDKDDVDGEVEMVIDQIWAEAIGLIEHANLTLILAELSEDGHDRRSAARAAYDGFTHALTLLEATDNDASKATTTSDDAEETSPWRFWPAWASERRDRAAIIVEARDAEDTKTLPPP